MAKIVYIDPSGAETAVEVPDGWTVMQGAVSKGVAGIEAECGGSCSCGTCHVYVDDHSLSRLPKMEAAEEDMLDFVAAEVKPGSRLACQIKVTPDLDGMIVRVPDSQG
jgi:2Fe-2S ferredoxin